uniref:Uncharacterized protein n=1 Tax=viral metagenome TaxID=1070528 RepID=A0A6M3J3E9_9ZZZZ
MGTELVLLHKIGKTTSNKPVDIINWTGESGYRYLVNEIYYITAFIGAVGALEVEIKIDGKPLEQPSNMPYPILYEFLMLNGKLVLDSMPRFQLRLKSDGTNLAAIEFFMSMVKEKI